MFPRTTSLAKLTQQPSLQRQRGSMLVLALFIIIVLAMMGATMVKLVMATSQSALTDNFGINAKNTAQVGLEMLGMQTFPLNTPIQVCATTITSPSSMQNIPGLQNCSYTASCTTSDVVKNGVDHYFYRFSSTGTCVIGEQIVSRTLSVEALQTR